MSTTTPSLDLKKEVLLSLYHKMLVIRRSERQLVKAHQMGLLHGACHTYIGEEAVAAGVCAHLRPEDTIFSTHRGHGHALAKGVPMRELIAELFGRQTGCSRGRGGSMHLFSPEVGLMGTSGIVGPSILQATGAAYAQKLLKTDRVSAAFFGDGAVSNGAFHEGLNLAAIYQLPVLLVCENNLYATEVAFNYSTRNPEVGSRGEGYGMPGVAVDGNDVLAVYQAAEEAVKRARSGGGPTLIECKTYRTRPHNEGMRDYGYRTKEEVEEWKARDPIATFQTKLVDDGVATEDELEKIDREIQAEAEEAFEFAKQSPWPDPDTATAFIFSQDGVETDEPPSAADGPAAREINFMEATLEALAGEMKKNPTIFVFGEGVGERGGNFNTTVGLYDLYGTERLCDTPISERGFTGLSTGAAMAGARPVVDFMFWDFALDTLGEILNQIAKVQYMSSGRLKMPILLRGCIGVGHSAATHHSGNYYPLFVHIPGLRVVMPSNPYDAKGLFITALRCHDPVLFLEHRSLLGSKGNVPKQPYTIPFGKAAIARQGSDVTVVAIANMVGLTLTASEQLEKENISVEVIDPRTLAPLDIDSILESVHKTGRLLVVDETFAPCAIGAEISSQVMERAFGDLDAPVRRLNGVHTPIPYSPALEKALVPHVEDIVRSVRELMAE